MPAGGDFCACAGAEVCPLGLFTCRCVSAWGGKGVAEGLRRRWHACGRRGGFCWLGRMAHRACKQKRAVAVFLNPNRPLDRSLCVVWPAERNRFGL